MSSCSVVMVFNTTFNNIVILSLCAVSLVAETGVPRENHLLQGTDALSHNAVSSTPRHERDSNSQR